MAAASTDYLTKVGSPGTATTLAAPGHAIAGTTFTVVSTTNWPTDTGVIFAVDNYTLQTVNGVPNTAVRTAGTYTEWSGVVASATSITGAVLRYGTDQNYSAGSLTRVYIPVSSSRENRLVDGLLAAGIKQDGTMGAIAPTSVTTTGVVTASSFVQTGAGNTVGWNVGLNAPNTITANGNRSYSMVFNTTDYSTTLSAGMRLRTTRTVAAPTQCTSLNGTTQYYSKTSPAGLSFTTAFSCSAWIKLSSYQAGGIIARRNGSTEGWSFGVNASGQLEIAALRIAANNRFNQSSQSVPLNKWVHVAATMDASVAGSGSGAYNFYMDGVLVPSGTETLNGTVSALVQGTSALVVGCQQSAGSVFFPGKIAQAAVYTTQLSAATILASMHQTLAGTETSLISAYSFNNSINDLNANANNLTANGSAVATNADSPFGGQAGGSISSTLDYAIVQSVAFSTNTTVVVQVPEGCTIPTSGGVSAVVYSSNAAPYGFPKQEAKWFVKSTFKIALATSSNGTYGAYQSGAVKVNCPIGSWIIGYKCGGIYNTTTTDVQFNLSSTALTGLTQQQGANLSKLVTRAIASAASAYTISTNLSDEFDISAAVDFVIYTVGATTAAGMDGTQTPLDIYAKNAYL